MIGKNVLLRQRKYIMAAAPTLYAETILHDWVRNINSLNFAEVYLKSPSKISLIYKISRLEDRFTVEITEIILKWN